MFKHIKKVLKKIGARYTNHSLERRLPRAAPSVEEAILPFDPETYTVTPQHPNQMMDEGRRFVLLDVREEWAYRVVHLEGAVLIPLGNLPRQFTELTPGVDIDAYCHRGMRSLDAAGLLRQLGFKSVKSLTGGIERWAQEIDNNLHRY